MLNDGKAYVGNSGDLHFNLMERYGMPDRGEANFVGFINPEGRLLDREQAFRWVSENEASLRSAEAMPQQLDAIDYREQVPTNLRRERLTVADNSASGADTRPGMASSTDNTSDRSDGIGLLSSAVPRLGPADARPPYNPMDRVREDARQSLQPGEYPARRRGRRRSRRQAARRDEG